MSDNYTPGTRELESGVMPVACLECDYYPLRQRFPEAQPCASCGNGEGRRTE